MVGHAQRRTYLKDEDQLLDTVFAQDETRQEDSLLRDNGFLVL